MESDTEYEMEIKAKNYELHEDEDGSFFVKNRGTGSTTQLEAEDRSSALFEAYHLVKD